MIGLEAHANTMIELLKAYAEAEGISGQISGLLILRELQTEGPPVPLSMAIVGEEPRVAIKTIHYAGVILTSAIRGLLENAGAKQPEA